ncbi:MAG: radical SAM family heme chaperone HemW [Oscillospiraceae bacterium]|nr:radical SAM family heme chaperone HemW [Oscillospiraceae bacterium]
MSAIYIHVPFCAKKCPYCDFYSLPATEKTKDKYLARLLELIPATPFDTVYLGGGTPSQLGTKRLLEITNAVNFTATAEVTLECNPSDTPNLDLAALRRGGYNRASLGLQSAVDRERKILGRSGKASEVSLAISCLKEGGFDNISLDIMLGIPEQSAESLVETLEFVRKAEVQHVSAYMLKIEENTPFHGQNLPLPNDVPLYFQACEQLEKQGFRQYEISNFARKGYESRHNLGYWQCEEYLGLGPAAHSFIESKRYYFPRDLSGFIDGNHMIFDGDGGDFEEYAILALRLTEGLREDKVRRRFGHGIPAKTHQAALRLAQHSLVIVDDEGVRLTRRGFLVSNSAMVDLVGA